MRLFEKLVFIFKNKLKNNKINLDIYVKHPKNIFLGKKCKILSNVTIIAGNKGIILGNNITLNRYVYLEATKGKIIIGDNTEINNFSRLDGRGNIVIGSNVLIGPKVEIITYQHKYLNKNKLIKEQGDIVKDIVIEDDVWIGAGSIILAGVTIKKGAVIGAGSVVTKDVNEYEVIAGVPAKKIKERI
jgi:acetyltransferase-like isoleucine patch superfamily enzyme